MATDNTTTTNNTNNEESSPLLGPTTTTTTDKDPSKQPPVPVIAETYGWPAHGLPLPVAQPVMGRAQWSTGLCSCFHLNDPFCSTDVDVCLIGSVAPCVLYGSNVERLDSTTGNFANHCLSYAALYLIGNSLFGWNCLAPWLSYSSRTTVRRMYNLEGSCEALSRHYGCCGSFVEDETQREHCETSCDFATHVLCHPCSLCQEGREIRRRLPHPGFNAQSVVFTIPPGEQAMGRDKP